MSSRASLCAALLAFFAGAVVWAQDTPVTPPALDFAEPEAVIELGGQLTPRPIEDATDPTETWYTIPVQNLGQAPSVRVLVADLRPQEALAIEPERGRAELVEAAATDPSVTIERAAAFGANAFRVTVPPGTMTTLALHLAFAGQTPSLLAWSEPALIARNRQMAVLTGLISGLLAAAMAFAGGAAALTSRLFPRWAALFLATVFVAHLTVTGLFDGGILTAASGPSGLFALCLALALAAALRLVDYVAAFEGFFAGASLWRDRAVVLMIAIGVLAFAAVPYAALSARIAALIGAAALAGYLAHCGRIGIAAARRLAAAAAIFALVTTFAAFNALGLFGTNLIASGAIGGISTAGALLVALMTSVPFEHSLERLRELRESHKNDDVQAVVTDEVLEQVRELAAVAASRQGVFDLDLETGLLSLSAEAAALLGLPTGAVELGREAWLGRIHYEDRAVYERALENYRKQTGTAFRVEFRIRGSAKRIVWCELRATMTGQATEAERCLGLIADVTARKSLDTAVAPFFHDGLTGLGNRAALQARLAGIGDDLARATLAVFDLDRFKTVNESLGRDGADKTLALFAERLENRFAAECATDHMVLFRAGGDMFAALALDIGDLHGFGRDVLSVTSAPFSVSGREVFLASSVGLASGASAEAGPDLLSHAEMAMVEAKREGGARATLYSVRFAEPPPRDAVALESELRRALERGEIEVYYQPIVRLADRQVSGFEALLRWRHPERGLISPTAFVPHAEESGFILPLGKFALERSMRDLALWQKQFPLRPPVFVSVNVAWRQIADRNFIDEFSGLMTESGIARRSLKLEVTESAVMQGADRARESLQRLKDLGVGLAVDDFGTGHSSLSHLRRFPFEGIKIDRSFVADAHDRAGAAILKSIVSLAHELRLAVVAEGVETESDAARLKAMGCEFGQGYFFGVAVEASEVPAYLANKRAG